MRKLGYAMVVGLTLVVVGPIASSPSLQPFGFDISNTKATDVVVTDIDGVVLETWRGELRPGDTVRLGPARLTPMNAVPLEAIRLRPDHTLSGFYCDYKFRQPVWDKNRNFGFQMLCEQESNSQTPEAHEHKLPQVELWPTNELAQSELRLVLFLRNEGTTGAGALWLPADAPDGSVKIGYKFGGTGCLRRDCKDDFTTCMAWVEAGRVLMSRALAQFPEPLDEDSKSSFCLRLLEAITDRISNRNGPMQAISIVHDLDNFKSEVLALPAPLRSPVADTKSREIAPSSLTTLAGLSSRLWAAPKK